MITSYILQLKVVEFKAFIHDKVDNDSTLCFLIQQWRSYSKEFYFHCDILDANLIKKNIIGNNITM